jgi:hypothetical protein
MSNTLLARIASVSFVLWGLLHVVGGVLILVAAKSDPASGYAYYQQHSGTFAPLAGAILSYFSYLIACAGVAAAVIAIKMNWHNSQLGLAINTIVIGVIEVGLVIFLVLPGFTPFAEASPGLLFFVVGIVAGGMACRSAEHGA